MVGLGVGAWWGGKAAVRLGRASTARRAYSAIMFVLAAGAPAVAWSIDALGDESAIPILALLAARPGVLTAVVAIASALPAVPAGAAFPILARARDESDAGFLYGLGSLGSALAAPIAASVAVPVLGVETSGLLAGALFASAALLARVDGVAGPAIETAPAPRARDASRVAPPVGPRVALFAAGFFGLAFEVLWLRRLGYHGAGFAPGLAASTGAALAAGAAGVLAAAAWERRARARHERPPLEPPGATSNARSRRSHPLRAPSIEGANVAFGAALAAAGASALLAHAVASGIVGAEGGLASLLSGIERWLPVVDPLRRAVGLFVSMLLVAGPTLGALAVVLPKALARDPDGLSPSSAAAWNAFGSAAGAAAAGLVLPRVAPYESAFPWVAAAAAAAGGFLAVSRGGGLASTGGPSAGRDRPAIARRPLVACAGVASIVTVAAAWAIPRRAPILASPVFHGPGAAGREVVALREGVPFTASVVAERRSGNRALYTDAFGTAAMGPDYRYMDWLGALPLRLHAAPSRVAVVGLGTGRTVRAAAADARVRTMDVFEISREVVELLPNFEPPGTPPLFDGERTRLRIGDGRRLLLAATERFDVLILEPLLPFAPSAVHFYTREFYALARARLEPGGILAHWIPIHATPAEAYAILARTFLEAFPNTAVFLAGESTLLLGFHPTDATADEDRDASSGSAIPRSNPDSLPASGPRLPSSEIPSHFVATGESLGAAIGPGPVARDGRTRVEALQLRGGASELGYAVENLRLLRAAHVPPPNDLARLWGLGAEETARAAAAGEAYLEARIAWRVRDVELRMGRDESGAQPILDALARVKANVPEHEEASRLLAALDLGDGLRAAVARLREGDLAAAESALDALARDHPSSDLPPLFLAVAAAEAGDARRAEARLRGALVRFPWLRETSEWRREVERSAAFARAAASE